MIQLPTCRSDDGRRQHQVIFNLAEVIPTVINCLQGADHTVNVIWGFWEVSAPL